MWGRGPGCVCVPGVCDVCLVRGDYVSGLCLSCELACVYVVCAGVCVYVLCVCFVCAALLAWRASQQYIRRRRRLPWRLRLRSRMQRRSITQSAVRGHSPSCGPLTRCCRSRDGRFGCAPPSPCTPPSPPLTSMPPVSIGGVDCCGGGCCCCCGCYCCCLLLLSAAAARPARGGCG